MQCVVSTGSIPQLCAVNECTLDTFKVPKGMTGAQGAKGSWPDGAQISLKGMGNELMIRTSENGEYYKNRNI